MRARTVGLWGALAASFAACGGTVAVEQSGAATGAGGSATSASSSSASSASASSSSASSTATGSSGAGAASTCGGLKGVSCAPDQYCAYPNKECGGNDSTGVCTPRPTQCPTLSAPACGCDQKTYENGCYAYMAGTDVDAFGGCTPPAGMFACGFNFCQIAGQYCEVDPSAVPGMPSTFLCKQIPQQCDETPTCACIGVLPCGMQCSPIPGGGLKVTCPAQ